MGRPAAQLDLALTKDGLQANLHILAFPGKPILRQWVEFQNLGSAPAVLCSPAPGWFSLRGEDAAAYTQYWMVGGNSKPNQGMLEQAAVSAPCRHTLNGAKTAGLCALDGLASYHRMSGWTVSWRWTTWDDGV